MTKEYEYILLTREQTETLWKDVTLYFCRYEGNFTESSSQRFGRGPEPLTYYLRVEKLDA